MLISNSLLHDTANDDIVIYGIRYRDQRPQKNARKSGQRNAVFYRQLKSFDPLFYRFSDFSSIRFFPSDLEKVQDIILHQTMGSIYFK